MTLTHSNHNHFADSSSEAEPKWHGLNDLGVDVVQEMNRLGIIVDISQAGSRRRGAVVVAQRAVVVHRVPRRELAEQRPRLDARLPGGGWQLGAVAV